MPCMIRAPHRRPRASTGARVSPAEASQRLERLAIADRTSGRRHGGTEGAVHALPSALEAAGLGGQETTLRGPDVSANRKVMRHHAGR